MMVGDEAMQTESPFLDRLARSERLESWPSDELTAALAVIDDLYAERRPPHGEAQVIDIRLMVYRRRLRYELDQRSARDLDSDEP
jgi:hypothetical protein